MIWNLKNGSVPIGETEMSYVSFGHGKRALVVLPGLSDGLTTVKGKALLLAPPYRPFFDKYTVYMFSRKNAMPRGYSIKEMADDQAATLKRLGIRKASALGVSQGGMIAQQLAIAYPEMVDRLIIAVSAPQANPTITKCVKKWIRLASQGNHKRLMIDTAEKNYSSAYLKKNRLLYPVLGLVGKPANYDRFLINAAAILQFDAAPELSKITCPTLIIGGGKDQIVGIEASYQMHKLIKNSRLYVYPDLGHAAYEEANDFYQRVFRFL